MNMHVAAARLIEPVPAHRSFGLQVERADAAGAVVSAPATEAFANVIGSMHSSGLTALIDGAGLAAIIGACADDREFEGLVPLGARAEIQFLAPARGELRAHCRLTAAAHAALRALLDGSADRAALDTTAEVRDGEDELVCRGTFSWRVRRLNR